MAKKTRRPNLPSETLERARRELARSAAATPEPAAETPQPGVKKAAPVRASSGPVDLSNEYAYVISDLQQMGMLAAALLAVLVILSFFF